MLPFISLAAGVSGISAFIWSKKSKCVQCGSKFTSNEPCIICGHLVCSSCGTNYKSVTYRGVHLQAAARCCNVHAAEMNKLIAAAKARIDKEEEERAEAAAKEQLRREAEEKRRQLAEQQVGLVMVYSKNYLGRVERPRQGKTISTDYYADQDMAIFELKILAVQAGCFVVQNLALEALTQEDGSYKHRVWRASGVI